MFIHMNLFKAFIIIFSFNMCMCCYSCMLTKEIHHKTFCVCFFFKMFSSIGNNIIMYKDLKGIVSTKRKRY